MEREREREREREILMWLLCQNFSRPLRDKQTFLISNVVKDKHENWFSVGLVPSMDNKLRRIHPPSIAIQKKLIFALWFNSARQTVKPVVTFTLATRSGVINGDD